MGELVPEEDREWLRTNKQVFDGKHGRWMTIDRLKKAVLAGKAKDWMVVDIDLETGEPRLICPYCATGVEHRGTFQ